MPGLPFEQLPADITGRIIGADGRVVEMNQAGDVREGFARILGNLKTGRDERVLEMGQFPSPAVVQPQQQQQAVVPDPSSVLAEQSDMALKQAAAVLDGERATLKRSIESDKQAAYRDYLIDLKTLNSSNMEVGQKKQRAAALYASYQKKAYGIEDRIKDGLDAVAQKEQEIRGKVDFERNMTQARMQAVAGFGRKLGLSDDDITREQFELLGVRLPQQKPPQTPRQELAELSPVVQTMQRELNIYTTSPKVRHSAFWNREISDKRYPTEGPLKVLKEEYRTSHNTAAPVAYSREDADTFRDATPEEQARYAQLQQGVSAGLSRMNELRGQIFQKYVPNLLSAATDTTLNPIAASVVQARSTRPTGQIVERGGQKWRIVGYDTDGEPLVERAG
jgi:hypothetical protein